MNPTRKLVLAAVTLCLFVLVLVLASAGLMAASEAGGRTIEERVVALAVLALVAAALACWVLARLYHRYVGATLRLAEELAAKAAHSGLRLPEQGAEELRGAGASGQSTARHTRHARTRCRRACSRGPRFSRGRA